MDMDNADKVLDNMHLLDVVSRRTRVSYRDIRQAMEELQLVLQALVNSDYAQLEDAQLLQALEAHPDVQYYSLPTEEDRRWACVQASNFVDSYARSRGLLK